MSDADRIPLAEAVTIAADVCAVLRPFCERLEVAGSIRRQRPTIGDLEVVCIPRRVLTGLFGDAQEVDPGFCDAVNQWPKVKGEPTGKYTQRLLPSGLKLDLFMPATENWGLIFSVRTGSARFSAQVLGRRWAQLGYKSVEGRLTRVRDGMVIPIWEERDLFTLLRLSYVEPPAREA
jgi:DNA polymerase/3'-5' exonuclease PolX